MADGTGVVADAGGAGAGQGAQGDGGAGAQGGGQQGSQPWYGGFDTDTQGWLQTKGWAAPNGQPATELTKILPEMIKSYRLTDGLVGRDKLPMPKDLNDAEGYGRVYDRLGRPKDAKGYGMKAPDGGNQEFADFMADVFHKAGLSTQQVQAIQKASDDRVLAVRAAADHTWKANSAAELQAVTKEWGAQSDANFGAAQRFVVAAKQGGLDQPMMEKIERAVGTKAMMALFAWAGNGLTEDRGSGGRPIGSTTPQMAQAKLNDLKSDQAWQQRYFAGGQAEKAEYDRLISIVAGS